MNQLLRSCSDFSFRKQTYRGGWKWQQSLQILHLVSFRDYSERKTMAAASMPPVRHDVVDHDSSYPVFAKKMPDLIKSENDTMEYRLIELENGLRAILVSDVQNIIQLEMLADNTEDEDSDGESSESEVDIDACHSEDEDEEGKPSVKEAEEKMAACALCIGVGSFSDPPDIPGLAHFLEHMVFMGSKKHPQENGFDEFIKKHGGSDNGSTECETTSFYLECNEKYLKEGMDRFAQFFISPLMKREAMQREREIIHSEFEMALPSDGSRREQILATFTENGHPAGKFLWGNLTTLRDNVSDELLYEKVHEFRKRHYSANRMTVAVQARLPLKTLEMYVREAFSDVPNNNLPPDDFKEFLGQFGSSNFNKLVWVKPVKDICKVYLTWVLPSYMNEYKSRPLDYVGWLIGHEGEGSLVSYLRQKVWALECVAGNDESGFEHNSIYSIFTVSLTLTEEGYSHLDQVLTAVFSYISMLQKHCPDKDIYDELDKICQINFRYKTESPSVNYVETLAESMHLYEPSHFIAGGELYLEYKPELITDVLSGLTPGRVNVIVYSKQKPEDFYEQIEPWFHTRYMTQDFPKEWMNSWLEAVPYPEFHIPEPNPYLTTNFSLLQKPENNLPYPKKIFDDDLLELWYRQDVKFQRPLAYYSFYLISPLSRESAINAAMLDVLASYLEVKFIERIYPANQAGLYCTYTTADLGLYLQFGGYNEKLPLLFDEILRLISKSLSEISDESNLPLFEAVMDEKSRSYYNAFLKPARLVKMARLSILVDQFWTTVDRRAVMSQITLQNLEKFAIEFFKNVRILSLIQGNVNQSEALALTAKFAEILQCAPLVDQRPQILVTKLCHQETCLRIKSFNETDSNSVITNYYQAGPADIQTSCIIDILMMLMDEPLFDDLRTKQQIGYDLHCLLRDTFGILGFSVTICFQAHKFRPDEVDQRIDEFLAKFFKNLKSMPKRELEETKMSLCELKSSADLQLSDEVSRNFAEICSNEYKFDRLQKEVAIIPHITHKELCDWLENHISSGSEFKKLSVQVVGECKQSDDNKFSEKVAECENYKLTTMANPNNKKSVFIADVDDFKKTREFYPMARRA